MRCAGRARSSRATAPATADCAGAAGRLEQALTEVGVEHDVVEYPDAGHSFLNRHNAGPLSVLERVGGFSYHHPSAEDAWTRVLRFFDVHLR